MQHMLNKNLSLLACRQVIAGGYFHVFCASTISECCTVSNRTREITSTFPLYLYPADDELALVVVVPHTTSVRGNRWELAIPKPFLESGVFHLQQVQPVSLPRLERKLGALSPDEFTRLGSALISLLHLRT